MQPELSSCSGTLLARNGVICGVSWLVCNKSTSQHPAWWHSYASKAKLHFFIVLLWPVFTTLGSRSAALASLHTSRHSSSHCKGCPKKLLLSTHELVVHAVFKLDGFSTLMSTELRGNRTQKLATSFLQRRTLCSPAICLFVGQAFSRMYASKGRKLNWRFRP